MVKKSLPNSVRRYIRRKKAEIRRTISDSSEQDKLIAELYNQFLFKKGRSNSRGASVPAKHVEHAKNNPSH